MTMIDLLIRVFAALLAVWVLLLIADAIEWLDFLAEDDEVEDVRGGSDEG